MTAGRGRASAQLLIDLVTDTLDPGYAAAAARHRPGRARWETPAVAAGCLVAGLVLAVAFVHAHRGAPEAARAHTRLTDRVRAVQSQADALNAQLGGTQRRLARSQRRALPASGTLARTLLDDQQAAGLAAVHGPGLSVTLREPAASATPTPGRGGGDSIAAAHILTDRDVRSVVNQLWSDGAEAVAVNGIRLGPTTAIRFAGDAVLVDYQPISSPYSIQAIGDEDTLSTDFAQSDVAGRYQTLVSADGIGFTFAGHDGLTLPAAAPAATRIARADPTPTASRSAR